MRWVAAIAFAALLMAVFRWADAAPPGDRPLPAMQGGDHLRIVAFGTSLTRNAVWPDRVASVLSACGVPQVSVEKVARPGAGSDWGLSALDAVAQARPDLVIIEFAMNDADLFDGVMPWTSRHNHLALIEGVRRVAPRGGVLLLTTNGPVGRARLQRPFAARYQALYGEIADQAAVGLVDGYGLWAASGLLRGAVRDGVHPDPEVEAGLLTAPIVAAIAKALGRSCR